MNQTHSTQARATAVLAASLVVGSLSSCSAGSPAVNCDAVSIEGVRRAVGEVDSYTWQLTGTDQVATTIVQDRAISYQYEHVAVEASGAYRAPDRGTWEIPAGVRQAPQHSSVFDFWQPETDAYVRIGDGVWLSPLDSPAYYRATEVNLLVPNVLRPILGFQPMAIEWRDHPWTEDEAMEMAWQTEADAGSCRLLGSVVLPSAAPSIPAGFVAEARAWVHPDSLLPTRVTLKANVPEMPAGANGWAYEVTWTIAYEGVSQIEVPAQTMPAPTPYAESPGPS